MNNRNDDTGEQARKSNENNWYSVLVRSGRAALLQPPPAPATEIEAH